MMRVRATTRGQVVIPKAVRDALNIEAGTELIVESRGDTVIYRTPPKKRKHGIDDLIGCLPYSGAPKTISDMERGIEMAIDDRWGRKGR